MALDTASPWFGWEHIGQRAKAMFQVTAKSGDSTSSSSDLPGVAWAQGVVEAPFTLAEALTVATPAANTGRALQINCTVAGNVTVTLESGNSVVVPVNVGLTILPYAATQVSAATATATYYNLR